MPQAGFSFHFRTASSRYRRMDHAGDQGWSQGMLPDCRLGAPDMIYAMPLMGVLREASSRQTLTLPVSLHSILLTSNMRFHGNSRTDSRAQWTMFRISSCLTGCIRETGHQYKMSRWRQSTGVRIEAPGCCRTPLFGEITTSQLLICPSLSLS